MEENDQLNETSYKLLKHENPGVVERIEKLVKMGVLPESIAQRAEGARGATPLTGPAVYGAGQHILKQLFKDRDDGTIPWCPNGCMVVMAKEESHLVCHKCGYEEEV